MHLARPSRPAAALGLTALLLTVGGCVVQAPAPAPATVTVTAQPVDDGNETETPSPAKPSALPTAEEAADAGQSSEPSDEPVEQAAPPPDPETEATVETFVMPDVVGMNLQLAQDTLQALGSYVMDQEDASGLERLQVLDSNWHVCSQDPSPGATVDTAAVVTLHSVKLDEACP